MHLAMLAGDLLADLVVFFEEHRRCGALDAGVEDGSSSLA
jgi:hypothetical protein